MSKYFNTATMEIQKGNNLIAIDLLTRAIALSEDENWNHYLRRSHCYHTIGGYDALELARNDALKASQLSPHSVFIRLHLTELQSQLKLIDDTHKPGHNDLLKIQQLTEIIAKNRASLTDLLYERSRLYVNIGTKEALNLALEDAHNMDTTDGRFRPLIEEIMAMIKEIQKQPNLIQVQDALNILCLESKELENLNQSHAPSAVASSVTPIVSQMAALNWMSDGNKSNYQEILKQIPIHENGLLNALRIETDKSDYFNDRVSYASSVTQSVTLDWMSDSLKYDDDDDDVYESDSDRDDIDDMIFESDEDDDKEIITGNAGLEMF